MPLIHTALIVLYILIAVAVVVNLTSYIARESAVRSGLSNPDPAMHVAAFLLAFWVALLWPICSLVFGLLLLFNLPKTLA